MPASVRRCAVSSCARVSSRVVSRTGGAADGAGDGRDGKARGRRSVTLRPLSLSAKGGDRRLGSPIIEGSDGAAAPVVGRPAGRRRSGEPSMRHIVEAIQAFAATVGGPGLFLIAFLDSSFL